MERYDNMQLSRKEKSNYVEYTLDLIQSDQVQAMKKFIQHGNTTTFTHSLVVSYYSYWLSLRLPITLDSKSIARGALLHDFYLYDWHIPDKSRKLHGFTHPTLALSNAKKHFSLNTIEKDIIRHHMWPLTFTQLPRKKEAMLVCFVDKICSLAETLHIHILPKDYDHIGIPTTHLNENVANY